MIHLATVHCRVALKQYIIKIKYKKVCHNITHNIVMSPTRLAEDRHGRKMGKGKGQHKKEKEKA